VIIAADPWVALASLKKRREGDIVSEKNVEINIFFLFFNSRSSENPGDDRVSTFSMLADMQMTSRSLHNCDSRAGWSGLQGCQIFLGKYYQNMKNVPNEHKMYQMNTKCTK
jgi:hypothetical protein